MPVLSSARSRPRLTGHEATTRASVLWAVGVAAMMGLPGCGPSGQGAPGPGGMPSPTVGVITAQPSAVAVTTELSGRLEAWRTAQVRARVTGIVQKRVFAEGTEVRVGQALYQLDDASFRAALASADAQRARAEATLAQAQAQYTRNQPLVEQRAISQQEWVATQAALKQAEADVAAARAAVQSARINVDYAAIQAPISGRIGRSQVTEGALVGPTDVTALATIQQLDPLYVNFTQSASEVLQLQRAFAAGKLVPPAGAKPGDGPAVHIVLDDGSDYPLPGKLLFSEKTVDPTTGQISLRAQLPNPRGTLLPGLFVKVRLVQARNTQAVLVPQQAVTRGANGDSVLVVGEDGKVAPRKVVVGGSQGSDWVVEGGLKGGEQIVVDGFQKLMMARGAPVKTVPWVPAAAASAAPASGPGAAASAASR